MQFKFISHAPTGGMNAALMEDNSEHAQMEPQLILKLLRIILFKSCLKIIIIILWEIEGTTYIKNISQLLAGRSSPRQTTAHHTNVFQMPTTYQGVEKKKKTYFSFHCIFSLRWHEREFRLIFLWLPHWNILNLLADVRNRYRSSMIGWFRWWGTDLGRRLS